LRVAYFSPIPPERTGVAAYSALLLPELERRVDVVVQPRGATESPADVDLAVYHVGNNVAGHGWIVEALKRHPGLVVLHDAILHNLVADLTIGRGDSRAYVQALEREGGPIGRELARSALVGDLPPLWTVRPEDFSLAGHILEHADGVVVHSRYAEGIVRSSGYSGPVWQIPMAAWPAPAVGEPPGLPRAGSPLVGCFGNLGLAKRVPQLLEAFALLRHEHPEALLVLGGDIVPPLELGPHLARLGLEEGGSVILLGYLAEARLWSLLAACDACVALRWPTMGETSGMAIRALSAACPLVVSDAGWFSELPDSVVAKVPVDEWEVETLAAYLVRLASDSGLRERLGAAGAEYARREHELGRVADAYAAVFAEALRTPRERVRS
jgi:glycosyltransferase involved in cell wall biosynthesis